MASFACGTRDEPYMPPPGQTPCCWSTACHGGGTRNIYKTKATSCGLFCIRKPCPRIHVRSGMQFPLTVPLGNPIPFRSQIPGHIFRQGFNRKPCPISQPNTGMHFPLSPSIGKCIPFQRRIPGWTFQNAAHSESASRSEYIRTWNIRLLGLPSIKGRPPERRARSSSRVPHAKKAA